MKKVFIIAAALIAALPVAHANTYSFTSVGTAGNSEITAGINPIGYPITVWGYNNTTNNATVSGSGSTISLSGTASSLSYDSNYGLGVGATSNEITLKSFVVFDFADPKTGSLGGPELNGATTATITIDNANSSWTIYGGNSAPGTNGIGSLTSLLTGTKTPNAPASTQYPQTVSLAGFSYLAVIAAGTCELNILKIDTNAVPEPGTFVMAGMALIGLGMALRKARKG
jgi:hypothetical protein